MNSVPLLRVAIIGCGDQGLRCAGLLGDARLVVVCDKDPRRAAKLAATAHACFATNSLTEALSFRPDAVIVATPPAVLAEIATQSLEAGAHVFVSRPDAFVPDDLHAVRRLATARRRTVAIERDEPTHRLADFLRSLKLVFGLAPVETAPVPF